MPRRKMLTDRQREALLDLPTEETAMLPARHSVRTPWKLIPLEMVSLIVASIRCVVGD